MIGIPLRYVGLGASIAALLAIGALRPLQAQVGGGVIAYPAGGQSESQQQQDQYECHAWATKQTGVDPTQPPPQSQAYYDRSSPSGGSSGFLGVGGDRNLLGGEGSVVSDAATGAAFGAIGGAIAGNAGTGALIGAGASALFGGITRSSRQQEEAQWQRQHEQQVQQQQQQALAQWEERMNTYRRAYSVCMSSRDYRVQ